MPVFNAIGFPDKITTDYMNTEASRDVREGNPSLKTGERMIAIKDPDGRLFYVTTEIKCEGQDFPNRALRQINILSMALVHHFFTPSQPAIEYTMEINDAVDALRKFEQHYASRGRAFSRAQDAHHITRVPHFASIGPQAREEWGMPTGSFPGNHTVL